MVPNRKVMLASALILVWLSLAQSDSIPKTDEVDLHRSRRELGGVLAVKMYKLDGSAPTTKFPHSIDQIKAAIDSYPIDEDTKKDVLQTYSAEIKEPSKAQYESIAQIAAKGDKAKEDALDKKIIAKLIEDQETAIGTDHMIVWRADSRDKENIKGAGGFFGYAPVPVEHARILAKQWATIDMFREWKGSTGKNGRTPFVAVGMEEVQKDGHDYEIKMPIKDPGKCPVKPKIVFNGDKLENSNVIGVASQGEIIFITGIPSKFIVKVDKENF